MKDLGSHLSGSSNVSVSNTSSSSSSSSSLSSLSASGGGNGTTSLVVSVPLSPVAGGAALNLPGSGGGSSSSLSSASLNLFQQAIQNRSEHLNFPNASRSTSSQQQQQQSAGQSAALSRSSPGSIPTHHLGADVHVGMLHRQSPLIQASTLSMDNGGRSSLSPQISGNVVHQSEGSGMLKVTYEKQPSSSSHGNIVSVSNSSRLASLQDDAMSSSRRSR